MSTIPVPLFVELSARSAFSFLDGASTPEALAERAAEVGMPALALADRFDLGGAVRFTRACEEAGVRPVLGAEILLEAPTERGAEAGDGAHEGERRTALTLLCLDRAGYHRLSGLITRARRERPRGEPLVPRDALDPGTGGLLALYRPRGGTLLSFRSGSVSPASLPGGERALVFRLAARFPGRFHLALEHHGLPEEGRRAAAWMAWAEEAGLPWVPVNAPRYARPGDRIVHDVLTCIRHDTTLAEAGDRLLPNGEWYLKSAEQMHRRWCCRDHEDERRGGSRPERLASSEETPQEAKPPRRLRSDRERRSEDGTRPSSCSCPGCRALRRTAEVAERCRFRIDDLEPRLPAFPTPGGQDADAFLRALVREGARERYGEELGPRHREQLAHELDVIARLELADYFLVMWDVVRFASRRGILVQGRGSAANSAVCYCLGITAVDPVGMDLLFERFLSEERGEAPDIDLDIAHEDREEVLQYVYDRWGREHAAMVCETITYRGKMAVRDAARVLGFSTETADRLSMEADRGEAADAARRLAEGGVERAGLDPEDPRTRALIRAVRGLHRLPRHRSIHVGGFVLTRHPVGEVVPVEPAAMEGRTVIQWDKDDLERAGLVKLDLLGLGMLTALGEGLRHVREQRGVALDLADLPAEDPGVYDMLCEADTVGVFQVESRAQMNTLPRMKPRCFYDLAIQVALIRPGPIQGEMVHPYLRRRRDEETVTYLDPRLEPVLERTLGVPLFQEQGMKVAVTLAGFTPAQADRLRRAMGFKRSERAMARVGRELEEGLVASGVPPEARKKIFRQLTAFANYGFPESHALSFALLVYASAYLKRHYAPEFYCALLNAQPMGFYAPSTLVHDARRHGVEVRPVDLAYSDWDCTLEPPEPALRIGLCMVRGLGKRARERLARARAAGPFTSVEDAVRRSGLDRGALRTLAGAGAFDSLWPGRREALWELLRELRGDAGPLAPRPEEGSRALPPPDAPVHVVRRPGRPPASRSPAALRPMSRAERVLTDYRTVGLSVEGHPMEFLRERLRAQGVLSAAEVNERPAGAEVEAAGVAICRQRPSTAKGVLFVTLEDETGLANFVVLQDVQEKYREELLGTPLLRLAGVVEREDGVVNVRVRRARSISARSGAGGPSSPARDRARPRSPGTGRKDSAPSRVFPRRDFR